MFATPTLAAEIDHAEARLCSGIADVAAAEASNRSAVVDVGEGKAVFAGPGSPINKMIGLGFGRPPQDPELDAAEALFAERGSPLQAEIATLADPLVHAMLARRQYEPRGFENVLARHVDASSDQSSRDILVSRIAGGDDWIDVLVQAFAEPDGGGVGGDAIPPGEDIRRWMRYMTQAPGFVCVAAHVDGTLAGAASLRVDRHIAQLCGAATLPAFRRRGIQTALLHWRLGYARDQGCDVAVVTTQPGSRSQQNVQRTGFALLYARQLWVKDGP